MKLLPTILLSLSLVCLVHANGAGQTEEVAALVSKIQTELEAIRGLRFKHAVKVANQSVDEFGEYLDRMLALQIPEKLASNYGKIVRKLGLYRGPEIQDLRSMAKQVMQSQAAAYYDPASQAFYVVMQELPSEMTSAMYAHELYHGLQDQHYDLRKYLLSQANELNDDELLARQAVVEGEATYVMTLWTLKNTLGVLPKPSLLEMSIKMQSQLDAESIRSLLKTTGPLADSALAGAVNSMEEIPPFMLETLVGAYLKGMAFVFAVHKNGWERVQKLYLRPPVSTEQILHPEKWLTEERPTDLEWPDFDEYSAFREWELLEANTLGELQWRSIFNEHELSDLGRTAAAGWNGDIFAVLEHNVTQQLLLVLYSSWDAEAEAEEFEDAYKKLLQVKYASGSEVIEVQRLGTDVIVVEGGSREGLAQIIEFAQGVRR